MPKPWKLLVVSLAVLVAGTLPAASASGSARVPAGFHSLSGTTSSGGEVQFQVKRTSTGRLKLAARDGLRPLYGQYHRRCPRRLPDG